MVEMSLIHRWLWEVLGLLPWRPAEGNAAVLALRRAGEARGRLVWRWESVRTPGQIVEVWKVSG